MTSFHFLIYGLPVFRFAPNGASFTSYPKPSSRGNCPAMCISSFTPNCNQNKTYSLLSRPTGYYVFWFLLTSASPLPLCASYASLSSTSDPFSYFHIFRLWLLIISGSTPKPPSSYSSLYPHSRAWADWLICCSCSPTLGTIHMPFGWR